MTKAQMLPARMGAMAIVAAHALELSSVRVNMAVSALFGSPRKLHCHHGFSGDLEFLGSMALRTLGPCMGSLQCVTGALLVRKWANDKGVGLGGMATLTPLILNNRGELPGVGITMTIAATLTGVSESSSS